MELDYCSSLHDWTRRIERQASRRPVGLPGMSQQGLRDYVANLQKWTDEAMQLSPHCEGVPIASPQVRMQHWRTAALGGHVPAMTHYAIGSGFKSDNTQIGRASCRERVCQYGVDLGGSRLIKKKN